MTTPTRRRFSAASGLSTSQTKGKKPLFFPCGLKGSTTQPGGGLPACTAKPGCPVGGRGVGYMGLQRSRAPSKGQTTTISGVVIYHNHIQNHKHQSSLRYIGDTVYLFIKACQPFYCTTAFEPAKAGCLSQEPSQRRTRNTQKPNPEAGDSIFLSWPPLLSLLLRTDLLTTLEYLFKLKVIDGCMA